MTITISEKDSALIARLLDFLRQEQAVYRIDARSSEPIPNGEDIVWDWEGCDNAEYTLSMPAFAEGWNAPENDHWDNY